jgi:hypothetical protein
LIPIWFLEWDPINPVEVKMWFFSVTNNVACMKKQKQFLGLALQAGTGTINTGESAHGR